MCFSCLIDLFLCHVEKQLATLAAESDGMYNIEKDRDLDRGQPDMKDEAREMIMYAGQSKRIWNELYKVRYMFESKVPECKSCISLAPFQGLFTPMVL